MWYGKMSPQNDFQNYRPITRWWSVSSNRSTAPWRPRIFFSSCSLQVQWSRYLCTFYVSVSVSVLILAMIQDQALVASKRSKHYLVGKKSPGHKKVGGSIKIDLILQIQGPHLGSKREESSSHWVPPSSSWTNATSTGWVICKKRFLSLQPFFLTNTV